MGDPFISKREEERETHWSIQNAEQRQSYLKYETARIVKSEWF